MALELTAEVTKLKITDDTLLWLRVQATFTGKSHQQIAREVLHAWAVKAREDVLHQYRLAKSMNGGEGVGGGDTGTYRGLSEK